MAFRKWWRCPWKSIYRMHPFDLKIVENLQPRSNLSATVHPHLAGSYWHSSLTTYRWSPQSRYPISTPDPTKLGDALGGTPSHLLTLASMPCATLPVASLPESEQQRKRCHQWSQCRKISCGSHHLLPRKIERYSGREIDRDPGSSRHAKFDENFKRLPVVRKPLTEYRQTTVEKSTKNMALVPKKLKRLVPTKEVLDAVMYLRRAKRNPDQVKEVLRKRIARLLKLELMMVLSELQRLDEWTLARQVFNAIRKEHWYKPNVYLFQTMVQTFGKSKQIKAAVEMFEELQSEGLQPDDSIKRELLRAYVSCGMIPNAVQLYKEIQELGLDRAARSILFHGLNDHEKLELSVYEKKKGYDWS